MARNFRITERVSLQLRAEFVNIFNRTYLGYPVTTNPLAPVAHNPQGQITGGFGTVNAVVQPNSVPSSPATVNGACSGLALCENPRSGTIIARIQF